MSNHTTENTLTGFGIATRTNKALKEAGLKEIRPQMVYRYIKEDMIPHVLVGAQKRVPVTDAQEWIDKYVASRVEKATAPVAAVEPEQDVEVDA